MSSKVSAAVVPISVGVALPMARNIAYPVAPAAASHVTVTCTLEVPSLAATLAGAAIVE